MVYLVLNTYLKMKQEQKTSWNKFLKEMKLLYKVLFLIMIVGAIFSIISLFYTTEQYILLFVGVFVELLSVILLSIFMQKDSIETSSDDIRKLDDKYKQVKVWLNSIGYSDKYQIQLFCIRCRTEIEKNNIANEKRFKFIEKVIGLFFVPLYASFISKVLGVAGSIDEIIMLSLVIGALAIIIYIAIIGMKEFFNPLINSTYIKMDSMVSMVQGMLDREFAVTSDDVK